MSHLTCLVYQILLSNYINPSRTDPTPTLRFTPRFWICSLKENYTRLWWELNTTNLDQLYARDWLPSQVPNPFQGQQAGMLGNNGFEDSQRDTLLLADGAMASENLPLFPLLQASRKIDLIFAVDSVSWEFNNTKHVTLRGGYQAWCHEAFTFLQTVNGVPFAVPNVSGCELPFIINQTIAACNKIYSDSSSNKM